MLREGFSLDAASRVYSLVVHRLLTAVASLVEHRHSGTWALVDVGQGACCSVACGIVPDHRSNLGLLQWQADS